MKTPFTYSVFIGLLSICFTFFLPCSVEAQEDIQKENSLTDGAWALQFQVDNYFTLKSFQGLALSLKHHTADDKAIRVGMNLSLSTNNSEGFQNRSPQDSIRNLEESNSDGFSIEMTTQYIIYPNPSGDVNLFFGAGPLFRISRYDSDSEIQLYNGSMIVIQGSESKEDTWAVGGSAVVGVEWFATKSISFLGEYSLSLEYRSTHYKRIHSDSRYPTETIIENDSNSFRISASTVRFGLSAYF